MNSDDGSNLLLGITHRLAGTMNDPHLTRILCFHGCFPFFLRLQVRGYSHMVVGKSRAGDESYLFCKRKEKSGALTPLGTII